MTALQSNGATRSAIELLEELITHLQANSGSIESLLAAHPQHADQLRDLLPTARALAELSASAGEDSNGNDDALASLGELGDFHLIREVGRGGMGIVYQAIQISLNRPVALKVLPLAATMDPRQLTRFRHEAQAAALLHHPNIVPVHGVGSERGVHYYAMQLIEGRSLAAVIAGFRLKLDDCKAKAPETAAWPSRENHQSKIDKAPTAPVVAPSTQKARRDKAHYRRLAELIAQAANALEYAHSMGVVHRDIKPGNLMLDNGGNLWVTDFGLAKLETAVSMTMTGDLVGTLRYMSPEQALARHGLVDHRTDVYSLGATFYELMTLRPAVRGEAKADILRHLAFEEPVSPRKLDKTVPTELETITLKCLAKNPSERYASAGEMAADLRRFVNDAPIKAQPPTVRQRAARWMRRHKYLSRSLVAVAAIAIVALVVSNLLIAQEKNKKEQALQTAQKRLVLIEKGNDLLGSILRGLNPHAEEQDDRPLRIVLGERLDRAAEKLEAEADGDPLAVAKIQRELAEAYFGLGYPERAIAVYEKVRETYTSLLSDNHADLLEVMNNLGLAYEDAGRLEEARAILQETLRRSKIARGPEHPDTLVNMGNLGFVLRETGQRKEAQALLEETYRLSKRINGPEHESTLVYMTNVAIGHMDNGRPRDALPLIEAAHRHYAAKKGPTHIKTLGLAGNLAQCFKEVGRLDEAMSLGKETLELRKAKLGPQHPDTVGSMHNLAGVYLEKKDLINGLPLAEESMKLARVKPGMKHSFTFKVMQQLSQFYSLAGRHAEAIALLKECLALRQTVLGRDHPDTIQSLPVLALAHKAIGERDRALALLEEALLVATDKLGPAHPITIACMCALGDHYRFLRQVDKGLVLLEKALPLSSEHLGLDSRLTIKCMNDLAACYRDRNQFDKAIPLFEKAISRAVDALGPNDADTLNCKLCLACAYRDSDRPNQNDLALTLFKHVIDQYTATFGAEHLSTQRAKADLAIALSNRKRFGEAASLLEEILKPGKSLTEIANLQTKMDLRDSETISDVIGLARAYRETGRSESAVALAEAALKWLPEVRSDPHNQGVAMMAKSVLARGYLDTKRFDLALPLFEEVAELAKAVFGPGDPRMSGVQYELVHAYLASKKPHLAVPILEAIRAQKKSDPRAPKAGVLAVLRDLATAYQESGRPYDALPVLEESNRIVKSEFGPKHANTLMAANALARGYWLAKKYDKSVPLYEELVNQTAALLGENHPATTLARANLGVNYVDSGREKQAIPLLETAVRASRTNGDMAWMKPILASGYIRAGETTRGVAFLKEELAAARNNLPAESVELAQELATAGLVLLSFKAWSDAEPALRECLAIRKKKQPDVWSTFNTQSSLGGALLGQKKFVEAEPLLLEGYQGMKQREGAIPPQGRIRLLEALERLVHLNEAIDNKDQADQWRSKLEAARSNEKKPQP